MQGNNSYYCTGSYVALLQTEQSIFVTLQREKKVSLFSTTYAPDSIKKGVGYSGMVPFARPEVALHFPVEGAICLATRQSLQKFEMHSSAHTHVEKT